jgi:hypothetical chaperone protein
MTHCKVMGHRACRRFRADARAEFEGWIRTEIDALDQCLDELLTASGVGADRVDRVFLTGGSSFVPVVRALLEARFRGAPIERGGELTSVASGLGLRGPELMAA